LTISVVLADANILFSRTLRDYFLYAADEGAIEIHWSRQILAEMSRNLREKLGLSNDSASRLEQLMNDYIEYALVEVDPDYLDVVEAVQMDAGDRHVLAAALSADADILLTDNIKHFPTGWSSGRSSPLAWPSPMARARQVRGRADKQDAVSGGASDAVFAHSNNRQASKFWEPNWEPTAPVFRQHRAMVCDHQCS
jgi:predicted nucleic acid-binding protein